MNFEKVNHKHLEIIFNWLAESHVQEFWDNSPEHKDDIVNFIEGRIKPSNYFNGIFTYWIGTIQDVPFCFILTAAVEINDKCPKIWCDHISKTGTTYSLDFCIGNKNFLGQGLAAETLRAFTNFFQQKIDPTADTFFIDPDSNNPRAKHVYSKAGFELVGDFNCEVAYWDFGGDKTYLMVKKL